MECHDNCGECCILLSISSPIPGLPDGKPAGVRCPHLMENRKCALFGKPERPKVCGDFQAEKLFCGTCQEEAHKLLKEMVEYCS
ncbi:MAG: YkgJ family cysteine cluster protein [Bacteroidales bacterium]|nr:YkgJ family cysteine cluster protein [Bacteroidales bacterium]